MLHTAQLQTAQDLCKRLTVDMATVNAATRRG